MPTPGYYRWPAIHDDVIAFTSEDDLWTVPVTGGVARRLTSGLGAATNAAYSPCGKWLAFSGREEGPTEVYVMPADGGEAKRITFVGAGCSVAGWNEQGEILYVSAAGQPFGSLARVFAIAPEGGEARMLPAGPASFISFGTGGRCVIARPSVDAAYWKRYRGGTAGDLWVDGSGNGEWRRLIKIAGNPSRPLWLGERIYFICDHEGVGNLYSCAPDGGDLRRHTQHEDFYVRGAATDGRRIVYHAGADLCVFDPRENRTAKVDIDYRSPRTQRNRKFIDAGKYLEAYCPHPQGHLLALTTRGKIATLGNWDGAVHSHGEPNAGRYRLATWLNDGKRLVAVSDAEGRETLVVLDAEALGACQKLEGLDLSRVVGLTASPKGDTVALTNVRNELIAVDLPKPGEAAAPRMRILDRSEHAPIWGCSFSADGRWIAYAWNPTPHTSIIKVARVEDGQTFAITRPVLRDEGPVFDPEGKYLYFLSSREFDPVYDQMHFDLGFPKGMRPYLVTLRKDVPSPFAGVPKPLEEPKKDEKKENGKPAEGEAKPAGEGAKPEEAPLSIDFDGIEDRIVAFPVGEGIYTQVDAIKGKVLFTSVPVEGALKRNWWPSAEPAARAKLEAYDLETRKCDEWVSGISNFRLSLDRKTMVLRVGNRLRVVKATDKPDEGAAKEEPGRKSGWVDLKRLRISVEPPAEWAQMYGEAWRLQREQFWVEDLAQVDWQLVYNRYRPLVDRVSCRSEFHDLLWEMQGELGSSHAYAFGGDYREEPHYDMGYLGADLAWDAAAGLWKITRIPPGDVWEDGQGSPLLRPGVNIKPGESILAINGRRVSREVRPEQLLVHQAGVEVALTIADAAGQNPRQVVVKTLRNEMPLRYRQWVEANRAWVHEKTAGRCGYVHIPDMGARGYAEFHRYFLAEVDREGLIVDVRFNGGGHVSALILEKLARRRLAYVQTRWFGVQPWPEDSAAGPMVALTNEFAGSDGDIFSHNFKRLGLGPLLGKRTWGGVIGIWPRHTLVDGGVTTQPEFSFWFTDIGWKVENYGVDPDIEVEYPPEAYASGNDPQLQRGLDELTRLLTEKPTGRPELGAYPSRGLPRRG